MNKIYKDLGLGYREAVHGVQSAILYELQNMPAREPLDTTKHLRVGIDSRAADAMGLATLLMEKGIFTQEEYLEHMRLAANTELARYQEHVREKFGLPDIVNFR